MHSRIIFVFAWLVRRLQGLGDIDRTVLGGVFAVYANRGVLARAHLATDIGGNGQGSVARLDIFGRFPGGERLAFFAGPGLTWSDRRHMQTYFGVTAEQSARSGFPQFDAGAGINSVRLSAGAAYRLDARWRLVGLVLVCAVISNLTQYLYKGASFGGMSGVVYGLFGYVWVKGRFQPHLGLGISPESSGIMIGWLFLCMTGLVGPIANAAHVAGLIVGAATAYGSYGYKRLTRNWR